MRGCVFSASRHWLSSLRDRPAALFSFDFSPGFEFPLLPPGVLALGGITMLIGIKPTVDIVFKKILGSNDHKDLPLHFLNELLPLAGREPVSSLTIFPDEGILSSSNAAGVHHESDTGPVRFTRS